MKRPFLVNFLAIKNTIDIAIKAYLSDDLNQSPNNNIQVPFKSIALIKKKAYRVKLIAIDANNNIIYQKEYETDNYGNLELKIALTDQLIDVKAFHIYETSIERGISFMLGTYYVINILENNKVVICDFDKTICDTKFSSLKEIYYSLSKPLEDFPPIPKSIEIMKDLMANEYQAFVLSASPHFYEQAITDWLYKHKVNTSSVFLKDYRDFFSFSKNLLSIKDVKKQGFYKLNQLVKILSMTGVPKEVVLIGDGFEADTLIYLTLYAILVDKEDSWQVWNSLKDNNVFKLTHRQHSLFLSKLYGLSEQAKHVENFVFEIKIRCNKEIYENAKSKRYNIPFIDKNLNIVDFYVS